MTIRERILSVYRNQIPDRIPFGIYNRYHRVGFTERLARDSGLGILDFYPVVSLLSPPWHVQPAYMSEVKNSSFNISFSWIAGKVIENRTIETPVGKLTQQIVKDPSYGSDWVEKPYIKSLEDYKIMQYITENTIFTDHEKAIKQRIKDLGPDGLVLGRIDRAPYQKLLIELVNPEEFLVDLYTNPGPLEELMETIAFRLDEQLEMALNSCIDVIWQPDNVTSDMAPPEIFLKYCQPVYKKNGNKCKQAGKVYSVHMDGKIKALSALINESPIDVIESFSMPMMGGDVSIEEALNFWPEKVICPNFPASLCIADEKEIVDYIGNMYTSFNKRPFMIQLSEDFNIDKYNYVLEILSRINFQEFENGQV
jgi:hypothetical protein